MSASSLFIGSKRAALRIAVLAIVFGAITGGVGGAPQNWSEYRNERFGLRLEYPADLFVVERETEAGDGQVFVAAEGNARLLVGGLVNEMGYTAANIPKLYRAPFLR